MDRNLNSPLFVKQSGDSPLSRRKNMKFLFFTFDGTGFSVAHKLLKEGNDVLVFQIQDLEDVLTKDEKKTSKPEKPKDKEKRLSLYDGILKKIPARKFYSNPLNFNEDEWFVFCDTNLPFMYSELALKVGFKKGNFPLEEDRMNEVSRDNAKEIVKKYYPNVKVKEYENFKNIEEGVSFLTSTAKKFVLKSNGDTGETIVPDNTIDAKQANEILISALKKQKKEYEQGGFNLEEMIDNAREITAQATFWNGNLVYTDIDFENKKLFPHNIGPNTYCSMNLVVNSNVDHKINKIAFPKYVYDTARKRKGEYIKDISLFMLDDGSFVFGEFCENRHGWDAFPTELAMSGSATKYFQSVMANKNPLVYKYGASVKAFNVKKEEGIKIFWDKKVDSNIYAYDIKKEKDDFVITGNGWDVAIATGVGGKVEDAVNRCYNNLSKINFKDKGYRNKEDFLSLEYETSIVNRLSFAMVLGLMKDKVKERNIQ